MKMKLKASIIIFLSAAMATLSPLTAARAGEGSRGGAFLPLGWNAEGEGLAGAATLLVRDGASGYYNPANLCLMDRGRAGIGTTKPVPGMPAYYSILSIGSSLLDTRTRRGRETPFRRIGAALTVSHLEVELAGGSAWKETTAGFSGAYSINHFNSIGLTFRLLRGWNDLENADSWGQSIDIGWTARLTGKLWFGVVGKNLYSGVSYPDREEEVAPAWNIALAGDKLFGRISPEADVVIKDGEINRFLGGVRVELLKDLFSFLGGVDRRLVNGKRSILHFGFHTIYKTADISVSFRLDPEEAFDKQTYVSIGYSL